jgi:gp16 family phage-associated protein
MTSRTSQEVKDEFERKGISIASWATANGFNTNLVFEVLSGRKKGIRGQSHKIAVKLGLKAGEIVDDADIATAING